MGSNSLHWLYQTLCAEYCIQHSALIYPPWFSLVRFKAARKVGMGKGNSLGVSSATATLKLLRCPLALDREFQPVFLNKYLLLMGYCFYA